MAKKIAKKKAAKPAAKKSAPAKAGVKRTAKSLKAAKPLVKEAVKPKITPAEEVVQPKRVRWPVTEVKEFRASLQKLRDRVVDEIAFLAGDNLNRSQRESSGDLSSYSFHMADHGTDNFDREFALNLVSSEQDVIYEIDDALRRLQMGIYGACEKCGEMIAKPRLKAQPFAKLCIKCQADAEKGRPHFRAFGKTISQTVEAET
ncbi:MAG: TraR/DksA family transcriptional regulator [Kiritimatiellaeota bacterium]|nr:TraR/DksA family transcriptional regulator [Kiritimatiellota bacterium]